MELIDEEITLKQCSQCHKWKPLELFVRDKSRPSGRDPRCKVCHRFEVSHRYKTNSEFKMRVFKRAEEWRKRNRHKARAHSRVNDAIRYGRLVRQPCSVCGNTRSDAHHNDYSKPLEVLWLCRIHHKAVHGPSAKRS